MARQNAYQKAIRKLQEEGDRQCRLIYGAAGLALHRHWGWRKKRIISIMELTSVVWNECTSDPEKSMIQICEEETEIEVQCGNGKSWRDVLFLNVKLDPGNMTNAKYVYMRQRQLAWLAPQIMAAFMVALHRKEGFGFDRLSRIYAQIQEIESEFGMDPKRVREACIKEAKVDISVEINKKPDV